MATPVKIPRVEPRYVWPGGDWQVEVVKLARPGVGTVWDVSVGNRASGRYAGRMTFDPHAVARLGEAFGRDWSEPCEGCAVMSRTLRVVRGRLVEQHSQLEELLRARNTVRRLPRMFSRPQHRRWG